MKALWHSNAPWTSTGYGQQTALFAPLVAGQCEEFTISSYYGLDGAALAWSGIPVLPGFPGEFGNLTIVEHATEVFGGDPRGGVVFTLMDVWVLQPSIVAQVNAACWVPVDHDPCPPAVSDFFAESQALPIAMSRFGQEQLQRFNPLYVPHGVDTNVYKPHDRTEVRERYGIDKDAFLVGIVAANKGRPSRKAFSESLQALAPFMAEHEDVYLYLHTTLDPNASAGENLPALMRELEIPKERVRITNQYRANFNPYPAEAMAQVYSAMDVLLNPAHGEGFGITPLEAQACGVPVIVGDNTAQREVGGAGWHVKGRPIWTGQGSWQFSPDVDDIRSALEECRSLPAPQLAAMKSTARKHALGYDRDLVFEKFWLPALAKIEKRFDEQRPVVIPAKAAA